MKTNPEVRLNDDGTLDEVVAEGAAVHLEQMSGTDWCLNVYTGRNLLQVWLNSPRKIKARYAQSERPSESIAAAQIISDVRSKARGRTRYEGRPPYVDEVLVGEIDRLRDLLRGLRANYNSPHWHALVRAEIGPGDPT